MIDIFTMENTVRLAIIGGAVATPPAPSLVLYLLFLIAGCVHSCEGVLKLLLVVDVIDLLVGRQRLLTY